MTALGKIQFQHNIGEVRKWLQTKQMSANKLTGVSRLARRKRSQSQHVDNKQVFPASTSLFLHKKTYK